LENKVGNVQKGLSAAKRKALPVKIWKKPNNKRTDDDDEEEEEGEENCTICMQEFADGDSVRGLPCNHQFHQLCIDQWLNSNKTCPVCKEAV